MMRLEFLLTRNFLELPAEKETLNQNGTSVEVILSSSGTDPNGFAVLHRLQQFQAFMSYQQPCQISSGGVLPCKKDGGCSSYLSDATKRFSSLKPSTGGDI